MSCKDSVTPYFGVKGIKRDMISGLFMGYTLFLLPELRCRNPPACLSVMFVRFQMKGEWIIEKI